MKTVAILATAALAAAVCWAAQEKPAKAANPDQAPELVGGPWLNTKDGKPVTFASRKGKPTLVAYWTFACSNCHANIPAYARLLAKYRPKGVEMISIHTPELKIERDVEEVKKHLAKYKIDYPVVIDNDNVNWNRWHVQVWPTLYVVDGNGIVKCRWVGELGWNGAKGEEEIGKVLDGLLANQDR
jgi:thiol-disulfide isomerase/thioredoxin